MESFNLQWYWESLRNYQHYLIIRRLILGYYQIKINVFCFEEPKQKHNEKFRKISLRLKQLELVRTCFYRKDPNARTSYGAKRHDHEFRIGHKTCIVRDCSYISTLPRDMLINATDEQFNHPDYVGFSEKDHFSDWSASE